MVAFWVTDVTFVSPIAVTKFHPPDPPVIACGKLSSVVTDDAEMPLITVQDGLARNPSITDVAANETPEFNRICPAWARSASGNNEETCTWKAPCAAIVCVTAEAKIPSLPKSRIVTLIGLALT